MYAEKRQELGRPHVFPIKERRAGLRRAGMPNRSGEAADDSWGVGLLHSTQRTGKPSTGGKGGNRNAQLSKETAPDKVGLDKCMQTSLRGIANKAGVNKDHRFQNLFRQIDEESLKQTYGRLNRRSAPGVDRAAIREYGENLEENVSGLVDRVKGGEVPGRIDQAEEHSKGRRKTQAFGHTGDGR